MILQDRYPNCDMFVNSRVQSSANNTETLSTGCCLTFRPLAPEGCKLFSFSRPSPIAFASPLVYRDWPVFFDSIISVISLSAVCSKSRKMCACQSLSRWLGCPVSSTRHPCRCRVPDLFIPESLIRRHQTEARRPSASSVYSLGGACPAATSKSFSALALSSAWAMSPQAFGHCRTSFSMTFSRNCNEAKVAMSNEMHAVLEHPPTDCPLLEVLRSWELFHHK